MSVLLMATFDTKRAEAAYIEAALVALGVPTQQCDISLNSCGAHWSAEQKLEGMARAAQRAVDDMAFLPQQGRRMVVAIGGGTGGQIALDVMRALPIGMPKVLVSTLPFDPRYFMADNSIILVPSMADLSGLNATTRQALDRAAAIVGGLYHATLNEGRIGARPSIGVTALGETGPGVDTLIPLLEGAGHEVTVFHANGFGGAAFTRWCEADAFSAVIDYTPHELTRINVAGAHVKMPNRFTAAGHLPRVTCCGGVNFIGLGEAHLLPAAYADRPQYSHSPLFTHALMTTWEGKRCARILAEALARGRGPQAVLIPMGGFSGQDAPGHAIEDAGFREAFAGALEKALPDHIPATRLDLHINDPKMAQAAADTLFRLMPD